MLSFELGDGEDLVNPTREGKRGRGRGAAAGIEDERTHRGGAITVENQRLRRARIVDARERVDLGDGQPSGDSVVGGDRGAFDPNAGSKVQ